ncbi:MAG: zinc metallopeptidase [Bacteroidales bacterium]|nr:zinc metallopeptidase [Bacteroidales bacterium]MDD3988876.1 zinc metallopeptidase [Bacteroidales bacterium]
MRWQGRRQSSNVEYRNSSVSGKKIGMFSLPAIIGALLLWWLTGDPSQALQMVQYTQDPGSEKPAVVTEKEKETAEFLSVVLADTEDVWIDIFSGMDESYRMPTLVFFRDAVSSACGQTSSQTGPFYCPGDEKVYIDISFMEKLQKQVGAAGDFVQAYIVAHEVGHHVQKLTGVLDKVNSYRGRVSEKQMNDLTVRLELQADFYAGVWAHYVAKYKDVLEDGDIEEAMNAARAIGDDTLQKEAQGYVVPDSFTHGTSAQRMRWFKLGYSSGDIRKGDTFSASSSSEL